MLESIAGILPLDSLVFEEDRYKFVARGITTAKLDGSNDSRYQPLWQKRPFESFFSSMSRSYRCWFWCLYFSSENREQDHYCCTRRHHCVFTEARSKQSCPAQFLLSSTRRQHPPRKRWTPRHYTRKHRIDYRIDYWTPYRWSRLCSESR